ncbi:pleckstrin homology domain-containing family H member 3 isoform 1-T1 [Ammospiza maritima maritima]
MPFPGGLWWLLCCRRGFTLLRRDYGEAEREADGEAEEEEEASFELRAHGDQGSLEVSLSQPTRSSSGSERSLLVAEEMRSLIVDKGPGPVEDEPEALVKGWLQREMRGCMKTPWIRPRKYWFVLTPDSLDYYSSNEKGARRLGSLVLTSLCSVLWPDKQLYKETGYWSVTVFGRKHCYRLYTEHLNEAVRWVCAVQKVIDSKAPVQTPTQLLMRDVEEHRDSPEVLEQIYRCNPILRYTSGPLYAPLLPFPYGSLDQSAPGPRSYTTLRDEAVKLFNSLQQLESERDPVPLMQGVLQTCLDLPPLVDEIYCQLVKQTTEPPAPGGQGDLHYWQLLTCMSCTFLPSPPVLRFLRFHLDREPFPRLGDGQVRLFHPRGAGKDEGEGVCALSGGDPGADAAAGDDLHGALPWGACLQCGHQFPHHSRGALSAVARNTWSPSVAFVSPRWPRNLCHAWGCPRAPTSLRSTSSPGDGSSQWAVPRCWLMSSPGLKTWLERTGSRTHRAGSASSTTASWTRTTCHETAWSLPSSLSRRTRWCCGATCPHRRRRCRRWRPCACRASTATSPPTRPSRASRSSSLPTCCTPACRPCPTGPPSAAGPGCARGCWPGGSGARPWPSSGRSGTSDCGAGCGRRGPAPWLPSWRSGSCCRAWVGPRPWLPTWLWCGSGLALAPRSSMWTCRRAQWGPGPSACGWASGPRLSPCTSRESPSPWTASATAASPPLVPLTAAPSACPWRTETCSLRPPRWMRSPSSSRRTLPLRVPSGCPGPRSLPPVPPLWSPLCCPRGSALLPGPGHQWVPPTASPAAAVATQVLPWPAWEGSQAWQRVAALCWPPESRGPGGRAPPLPLPFWLFP